MIHGALFHFHNEIEEISVAIGLGSYMRLSRMLPAPLQVLSAQGRWTMLKGDIKSLYKIRSVKCTSS